MENIKSSMDSTAQQDQVEENAASQQMMNMDDASGSNQKGVAGNMSGAPGGIGSPEKPVGKVMGSGTVGIQPPAVVDGANKVNGPSPIVSLNTKQLAEMIQKLKNNPNDEGNQQILQILRQNPQIMAAIIKQRQQLEQPQQMQHMMNKLQISKSEQDKNDI